MYPGSFDDDFYYPDCPICGEPIDCCLGHGPEVYEGDNE